ncbi:6-phospho-3-hexuloisomerase [Paenibacillus senegalimassiliensis]|uniref:6-phospho-3-hexuloisomerase n=1 Tax=Paenibacillus senegalimassiliensis TaxID=1737426 RepID=UPI00073E8A6F|nr:6-phospho-3-hexuloisomerase [Paenibacillus senegalimassiliensis]
MLTSQYSATISGELTQAVKGIPENETAKLVERILQAGQIFVAGAGRSGLMMRAFAMRLAQLGLRAYVVGETVTPGMGPEDVLIIGSGSGETRSLVPVAEKAAALGGAVVLVTLTPESTIGRLSVLTVKLPGSVKDRAGQPYPTIQPMGALFEQTLLLFGDAVVLRLMELRQDNTATMYGRHANLE